MGGRCGVHCCGQTLAPSYLPKASKGVSPDAIAAGPKALQPKESPSMPLNFETVLNPDRPNYPIADIPDHTLFVITHDRPNLSEPEYCRNGRVGMTFSVGLSDGKTRFAIWFTHKHNRDGFEWDKLPIRQQDQILVRPLTPFESITLRNQGT